jgi:hypothetical protein
METSNNMYLKTQTEVYRKHKERKQNSKYMGMVSHSWRILITQERKINTEKKRRRRGNLLTKLSIVFFSCNVSKVTVTLLVVFILS